MSIIGKDMRSVLEEHLKQELIAPEEETEMSLSKEKVSEYGNRAVFTHDFGRITTVVVADIDKDQVQVFTGLSILFVTDEKQFFEEAAVREFTSEEFVRHVSPRFAVGKV